MREIDLVAFFENIETRPRIGNVPPHVSTTLVVECKKSEHKPWVFFSTPRYHFENVACFLRYSSDLDLFFSSEMLVPLLPQIHDRITSSHYVDGSIPRCIGYQEAFRDPDKPSEIYKAIDSTLSYLAYALKLRNRNRRLFGVYSNFLLPVIVLEGKLFEAQLDESDMRLQERSHLQLRTMYKGSWHIIDVVTKEHFETFFNEVESFHDELVALISCLQFPDDLVSSAAEFSKQMLASPDEDGWITMASRSGPTQNKQRRSKIKLKSAFTST